jgi:hypothetical protein
MIKRRAVFVGITSAALAAASCADMAATPASSSDAAATPTDSVYTAGKADAAQAGARVMLKLRDPKVAVDAPATLDSLARICHCELGYVRALSGDAHLLTLTPALGTSADEALARLRASPMVQYADRDRVRHTM